MVVFHRSREERGGSPDCRLDRRLAPVMDPEHLADTDEWSKGSSVW